MTSNPTFQDSKPLVDQEAPKASAINNIQPPDFLILRSGQQTPERFINGTLDEAKATAQRQVRQSNGATKRVFVYQLVFAEQHMSSSETLDLEGIKALYTKDAAGDAE